MTICFGTRSGVQLVVKKGECTKTVKQGDSKVMNCLVHCNFVFPLYRHCVVENCEFHVHTCG